MLLHLLRLARATNKVRLQQLPRLLIHNPPLILRLLLRLPCVIQLIDSLGRQQTILSCICVTLAILNMHLLWLKSIYNYTTKINSYIYYIYHYWNAR